MTIEEIEKTLPTGFHDASLKRIDIDYVKHEAILEIEVDIENPKNESHAEDYQVGKLTLSGLLFCVIEPPDFRYTYPKIEGLWITGSGPIESAEIPTKLPTQLPEGAFVHCFYISNWNASIYLAAMDARFEWK